MKKPLLEKLIQEIAMFDMVAAYKLHSRKHLEEYRDKINLINAMAWDHTEEGNVYWSDVNNKLEAIRKNYHPHRDLMIELANDKTIEIEYLKDEGSWSKYDGMPLFFKFKKYRKKQKMTKKVIEYRIYLTIANEIHVMEASHPMPADFYDWFGDWQKVEIEVEENN